MKYFLAYALLIATQFATAQFLDNFADTEFTTNPTWMGDDSVFTVVDIAGNQLLRSNKLIPSSSFYLSTPSTLAQDGQWEFFVNLQFSTSGSNYVDIYLTADQANLLNPSINGYFVRVGGTLDEVSLFKKVSGTATKIIDGTDATINSSNNSLKIKVTRTATNDWKLERDPSATGISYIQEGLVTDATITTSSYFGVSVTQSTASFFQKHFFDDFYVGPIVYDVTAPILISATAINSLQVDVLFNEPLDPISAALISNYVINPSVSILNAAVDIVNASLVHLTISPSLINGTNYTLTTTDIADISTNISGNQFSDFSYLIAEIPMPGDVIINEFIADETPSEGLPMVEYVEIYNKSSKYFNLQGWKLGDASSLGTIQTAWLAPGEYKVLCSTANVDTFTMTTAAAVTSFPSLNNAGDNIVLIDNAGIRLDSISYNSDWYHDPLKENGGFSIERINSNDPCSDGDNWRASVADIGGTPGQINSVNDPTADTQIPYITELLAFSPNFLEIHFSEGMDSTSLANALIAVDPNLTIQNNYILSAHPSMMTLAFNENFIGSQEYTIELQNVGDCWMNTTNFGGIFALPENPIPGDIIFNELLFDPLTGGYDWIEVYNNSEKLLDLKDWQIANYDNDTISNHKIIGNHFYLKSGEYAVLGKDSMFVKQNYPASISGTFVFSETPSMNVDSSTIYLIYADQIIDKVSYSDSWHFKLLDKTDGVTLERMDPKGKTDDKNNWHSAAEAIGFGTPGGKNSQYYPALSNGDFSFTSTTVSPDNDGFEDVLQVNYEMSEASLLGDFSIYDDRGRKIRKLFSNELLATSGTFSWDGVTDENVKASIGTYVAVFEAFSLDGAQMYVKTKAFVVAGKL
jgi:hypothetical protein